MQKKYRQVLWQCSLSCDKFWPRGIKVYRHCDAASFNPCELYLVIEDPHCVQSVKVLLQEGSSSRVQVDFIQLQHSYCHPEQSFVHRRVLQTHPFTQEANHLAAQWQHPITNNLKKCPRWSLSIIQTSQTRRKFLVCNCSSFQFSFHSGGTITIWGKVSLGWLVLNERIWGFIFNLQIVTLSTLMLVRAAKCAEKHGSAEHSENHLIAKLF